MNQIVGDIDSFVWGPVMLCLLVGTGIYLTAYLNFRTWRNLPYAMKSVFSREARKTNRGSGDVSPFSALMTALAATIGTGNIVGVATAMVAGMAGGRAPRHVCRWSGRSGMDVGFRLLRPDDQVF